MNWIFEPWPWYISGVIIALVMFLLLMMNKNLGMSANLRTLCTICGADSKVDFFKFDWKTQRWNLIVLLGTVIGGYLAVNFMTDSATVAINTKTVANLHALGFKSAGSAFLPTELFANTEFTDLKSMLLLAVGGLLVGFGTRYAGGCTSGHAISGLSDLQFSSLIAVVGFFIGGLFMVHVLFPVIFNV